MIKQDQTLSIEFVNFQHSKLDFFIEYSCSCGEKMSSLIKYLKQDQTGSGSYRINPDQKGSIEFVDFQSFGFKIVS